MRNVVLAAIIATIPATPSAQQQMATLLYPEPCFAEVDLLIEHKTGTCLPFGTTTTHPFEMTEGGLVPATVNTAYTYNHQQPWQDGLAGVYSRLGEAADEGYLLVDAHPNHVRAGISAHQDLWSSATINNCALQSSAYIESQTSGPRVVRIPFRAIRGRYEVRSFLSMQSVGGSPPPLCGSAEAFWSLTVASQPIAEGQYTTAGTRVTPVTLTPGTPYALTVILHPQASSSACANCPPTSAEGECLNNTYFQCLIVRVGDVNDV